MTSVDPRIDLRGLFEDEPTPCAILTPDFRIADANDAYLRITLTRRHEIIGRHVCEAFPPSPDSANDPYAARKRLLLASLERVVASGRPDGVTVLRHEVPDEFGQLRPRFLNPVSIPVRGADGRLQLILHRVDDITDCVTDCVTTADTGVVDLTEVDATSLYAGSPEWSARLKALQDGIAELRYERDQLAARALRDPLTGALSRSVFHEELARALARLARRPHPLAVLFIDLDRLKQVNDCHGHAAGDELIRLTVERLAASVRPSDAIARLGGDEFVVLLDDLTAPKEAEVVAERILRSLSEPCPVSPGVLVNPSASVGVALAENDGVTPDALLSHADAAMYKAKQSGRGRYALFDAAAFVAQTQRVQLEGELRRALDAQQLVLHYQPIFDLTKGTADAVEALLRWEHPTRGTLTADTFIDVAEDSGLLSEIGPWVIAEACRQLARWDASLGPAAPKRVFVNLSVGELLLPRLHESITASAYLAGVAPNRLVIEVTESGILDKPETVSLSLNHLLDLGCSVAIDDFGTGYSALSRLVELPADILKIDRSFVRGLSRGQESAAVIAAVLLLAHNLRKTVVAEGVEDADALATLSELGCEHAQGYHLGRPVPPDVISEKLRAPALVLD